MTDQWLPLPRAREELRAARVLADAGFGAAAVSRSCDAAFYAAEAALLALEERSQADYGLSSVPVTEGEVAAVDAEEVVTLIEAWVAARAHRQA